jgi:hypothetical protein
VASPATAALGRTTVISVTVQTGVATASVEMPAQRTRSRGVWLALLLPLGLLGLRRRSTGMRTSLLLVLMAAAIGLGGCGSGGRYIPPPGSGGSTGTTATPTASGTYAITVAASDAGLTRTVALTLVVQ